MRLSPSAQGDPVNPAEFVVAARRLLQRGAHADNLDVLDRAIGWLTSALETSDLPDQLRLEAVVRLADALVIRYERTTEVAALLHAIKLLRGAGNRIPAGTLGRLAYLSTLARALLRDAERTGSIRTINKAERACRKAVQEASRRHPLYPRFLSDLGAVLVVKHSQTNDHHVLRQAIRAHEEAVAATAADDALRAGRLSNLGNALGREALVTGSDTSFQAALDAHREAVSAMTPDELDPGMLLSNLGIALHDSYERHGSLEVLNEAIEVHRQAISRTPAQHAERASRLGNLAGALLTNYERSHDVDVLAETVRTYRDAVDLAPDGHPVRPRVLSGLGSALLRRFEANDDTASLDEAVERMREAIEVTPPGHPNMPTRLNNLANALGRRAEAGGQDTEDLDGACDALREAIKLAPEGHMVRPMYQSNLGVFLTTRFEQTQVPAVLEEAIVQHRAAIAGTSADHSERGWRLSNLALTLVQKARIAEDAIVLDEAFRVCEEALDAMASGDPGRAKCLTLLGAAYECQFDLTGETQAADKAVETYQEAADCPVGPASVRIGAGRDGGQLAARAGNAVAAVRAFTSAVELMEQVISPAIGRADKERILGLLSGLPRDAAAMAIECGRLEDAVVLLEQGRGVMLTQAIHARTQYDALHEREPELAQRLVALQRRLEQSTRSLRTPDEDNGDSARVLQPETDQRNDLARQRDLLVARIRSRPGLEDFQRPPLFERLRSAAADGPVVILNVSVYRCDALILTAGGVRATPLPHLTAAVVNEHALDFVKATDRADSGEVTRLLQWTWDAITEPVLRDLGMNGAPQHGQPAPRVWWCPTGLATFLPLHAAGHYSTSPDPDARTVIGWTAPSYTPTLRTLIHLRDRATKPNTSPAAILIVGIPTSPGTPDLPGADRDVQDLTGRFRSYTVLTGPAASPTAVLTAMTLHPWVHFSCHGVQKPAAPSESRLVLHGGPLSIRQIMTHDLPDAQVAFVSACDTYRGGTNTPDEAITLASALQIAGYQHVIATQWQVHDSIASELVRHFYNHAVRREGGELALDVSKIAGALRAATLETRDSAIGAPPMYWAPYIHTGP